MRLKTLLCALLPIAAAAVPANAATYGTVTATYGGLAPGLYGTVTMHGAENGTYYAGLFNWTRTGGTLATTPPGPGLPGLALGAFQSFCVDILQAINPGSVGSSHTFTVKDLTDAPVGGSNVAMSSTAAGYLKDLYDQHIGDVLDATTAAAFQVAIWEIVYDTGLNAASGSGFSIDAGAIRTKAQTWLTALDGTGNKSLFALTALNDQDQLSIFPVGAQQVVPLPSAAAAALPILMLGGAVLNLKRRRNRAEQSANL